jgi:hypothetical protein
LILNRQNNKQTSYICNKYYGVSTQQINLFVLFNLPTEITAAALSLHYGAEVKGEGKVAPVLMHNAMKVYRGDWRETPLYEDEW